MKKYEEKEPAVRATWVFVRQTYGLKCNSSIPSRILFTSPNASVMHLSLKTNEKKNFLFDF